ncbi:hypothetical protein LCGC14_1188950 [marine sediment metagenome]|uniref:HTH cro/C1-type domain-containing protein n=1 Tax=marine sediment metagenome TaxID=412755 RepID=A0A0F9M7R5_9ZZZZ
MGVRRNQPMGLGVFVAERLETLGLTQRELAESTGVSESEISRLVSGDRGSAMSLKTAMKLSRGLIVTVDELLIIVNKQGETARATGVATPGKATKTTS